MGESGDTLQARDLVEGPVGLSSLERHSPDIEASTLEIGGDLLKLWQSKYKNGQLPTWKDFSFRDFSGHHAHLALSEIDTDGLGPKFRIFGSEMAEAHGRDYTGCYFSELNGSHTMPTYLDHFQQLVENKLIGVSRGRMIAPGREHARYFCIELPLCDHGTGKFAILHRFQRFLGVHPTA